MNDPEKVITVFILVVVAAFIGSIPCLVGLTLESDNQQETNQIIIIPYPEPLQPAIKGVIVTGIPIPEPFIITTNTPCSEPYRISINVINPEYDVGDWVKSNKDYEKFMRKSFQGQIIEISDTDVATVCINNDTYKHMDKFWLMHWDCEMIIHDPDIGYYCYTKLIDGTYCFNENSTLVSVIYNLGVGSQSR